MYDPIMRVLTVLEILQAREHVSGAELAERLEVDIRTVQRYVARLQDLSIPIESVRGVGGFYRLRPGFRLPPLMFTDEEAFALSLGLRALRQLASSGYPRLRLLRRGVSQIRASPARRAPREHSNGEDVVAVEPGPWVI